MTLLQSCIVYQKNPVSLLQAEQSKERVKINTSSKQTYHFKQIALEEEHFYGLKKEKGEIVRIAISDYGANEVFLQSKSKSTWTTIAVIAVPVITLAIIGANSFNINPGISFE